MQNPKLDSVVALGKQYEAFIKKHAKYKGKKLGREYDTSRNKKKASGIFKTYRKALMHQREAYSQMVKPSLANTI